MAPKFTSTIPLHNAWFVCLSISLKKYCHKVWNPSFKVLLNIINTFLLVLIVWTSTCCTSYVVVYLKLPSFHTTLWTRVQFQESYKNTLYLNLPFYVHDIRRVIFCQYNLTYKINFTTASCKPHARVPTENLHNITNFFFVNPWILYY